MNVAPTPPTQATHAAPALHAFRPQRVGQMLTFPTEQQNAVPLLQSGPSTPLARDDLSQAIAGAKALAKSEGTAVAVFFQQPNEGEVAGFSAAPVKLDLTDQPGVLNAIDLESLSTSNVMFTVTPPGDAHTPEVQALAGANNLITFNRDGKIEPLPQPV